MATFVEIRIFEDSIADFKQCLIDLERPGLCWHLGRTMGEYFNLATEVVSYPPRALHTAVRVLPDRLLQYGGRCGTRVSRTAREFCLTKMGPVEIVLGCLPDPVIFERACEGDVHRKVLYNCANEILTYLVTAFGGRDRILAAFDDPLLRGLLDILDEAGITPSGVKDNDAHKYRCWSDGLRMLAWKQLGNGKEAVRRYTPQTRRVLEYLRWVVLGRKDVTCMVRKPWSSKNPETLSWGAPTDLRRLFAGGFFDRCSYCSAFGARHQCVSCQPRGDEHHESGTVYCNERCLRYHSPVHAGSCKETRGLIRRVELFQDAFNTYLAVSSIFPFAVWMENGAVIKLACKRPPATQPSANSVLVEFSSRVDLSRPGVEAALHNCRCCEIRHGARALLDFFIRPACTSIRFCDFVPKNIECPVSDEGHSQPINTIPYHTIAVLSTASGLEFAFDPTAAQFGWKEYLSPWSVYRERRVDLLYDQEVARPLSPACALTRQKARYPRGFDRDSARAAQEIVEDAKARFRDNTLECGALDCFDAEFQAGRRALRVLQEVWVERWVSRKGVL